MLSQVERWWFNTNKKNKMLLSLAIIFLVLWIISLAFHILGGLLYIFLVLWVVSLIAHFVRAAVR